MSTLLKVIFYNKINFNKTFKCLFLSSINNKLVFVALVDHSSLYIVNKEFNTQWIILNMLN